MRRILMAALMVASLFAVALATTKTHVEAGGPIAGPMRINPPASGTATPPPPGLPIPFHIDPASGMLIWGTRATWHTPADATGHFSTQNPNPGAPSMDPQIVIEFWSDDEPDGGRWAEVTTTPPGTTVRYNITTP